MAWKSEAQWDYLRGRDKRTFTWNCIFLYPSHNRQRRQRIISKLHSTPANALLYKTSRFQSLPFNFATYNTSTISNRSTASTIFNPIKHQSSHNGLHRIMAGLSANFTETFEKAIICVLMSDKEKMLENAYSLVRINVLLVAITWFGFWALYKPTDGRLDWKHATITISLIHAFITVCPWLIQSSKLVNPLLACPFDFCDFAVEVATFIICRQLVLLRVTAVLHLCGVRDRRIVAAALVLVFSILEARLSKDAFKSMQQILQSER